MLIREKVPSVLSILREVLHECCILLARRKRQTKKLNEEWGIEMHVSEECIDLRHLHLSALAAIVLGFEHRFNLDLGVETSL